MQGIMGSLEQLKDTIKKIAMIQFRDPANIKSLVFDLTMITLDLG